jgi:imidazole glycerol phosphate synthase glutamine amidotransferase subunit
LGRFTALTQHDARRPRPRIAVIDYGAGNLVSIGQALQAVGADVVLAARPEQLRDVDGIVVPGVGAAAPAMNRLRRRRLLDPIRAWLGADRPFLGICLGLQLLFEGSDEDGARTFGLIAGRTSLLPDAPRLPHIGWNQVELRRDHRLFDGIPGGSNFYFVHSYAGFPNGPEADLISLADTEHGGRFVSAVARGRMAGVQFHPERSGRDGLRLLANFVTGLADDARAPMFAGAAAAAAGTAAPADSAPVGAAR